VIGNEAVYTKPFRETLQDYQQGKPIWTGLLGMDLIRIRSGTMPDLAPGGRADRRLVEEYGQFGSGARAGRMIRAVMIMPLSSLIPRKPGSWKRPAAAGQPGEFSWAAPPSPTSPASAPNGTWAAPIWKRMPGKKAGGRMPGR